MTPEYDIHDMIRELTTEHSQREKYEWQEATWNGETFVPKGPKVDRIHWVKVPALVVQLEGARDILGSEGEEGSRGAPTSKPATRIEAIDTIALIDFETADWMYRLGALGENGTINRLNRVHGLYPSTATCRGAVHRKSATGWCCHRGWLEHDVKRWWQQARITTGWDMPAFKPNAACPVCETKGTLRVKVDGAMCVDPKCRTVWDANKVGLLAEHIRDELEKGDASIVA